MTNRELFYCGQDLGAGTPCQIESMHGHISNEDRLTHFGNKLIVSKEAQELARIILGSFDGLTPEQRKSQEAAKLGYVGVEFVQSELNIHLEREDQL
jgi:hypothetical protein